MAQRNMVGEYDADEVDIKKLPLWMQGDADMYTVDNIAKRRQLTNHPDVRAATTAFWDVMDDETTAQTTFMQHCRGACAVGRWGGGVGRC